MSDFIGKTIGDYQLNELIDDVGRMAVYQGVQTSTNHPVAIKVLKPELASEMTAVQAFTQYAQMAARMSHPNLLPIMDTGQAEGIDYLVTPFIENRSLAENRSSFSNPSQVTALFRALAPGLEYIYNQGTVHGNLRPTNILLDAQRQPLLSNIGAAFSRGETPIPYTSPEQVQGGAVDQRTDIFALGVIIYELLAGQVPTAGTVLNLHAVRPDLPAGVDQVVQKATAQNPDQRYQTTGELLNALAKAQQPVQEPAPAPTPAPTPTQASVQQAPAQGGTNWTGILLGAILVIVLCLVVIVVGPRVVETLNPSSEPVTEQPVVEQPVVEEPVIEEPVVEAPEVEVPEPDVELEAPELPAEGEGGGSQQVCGSLGGAGGIVLLPGIFALRRRKRHKQDQQT